MFNQLTSSGPATPEVSTSSPVSSIAAKPRQKRAQVVRACDACRNHRTKCDNSPICHHCRSRGTQCSNSDASRLGTLSHAQRENERLRKQIQELRQELELLRRDKVAGPYEQQFLTPDPSPLSNSDIGDNDQSVATGARKKFWEGIHIVTARSPHETWYGASSLFYFIKRVTTVLSDILQQNMSAATVLPSGASKLLHGPTSLSGEVLGRRVMPWTEDATTTGVYLNATQEEYFIALFWQAYHTSLFPILDEMEFTKHYRSLWTLSATTRSQSALVDIVIALCMQYGISRLPSQKQGVLVDSNDATIAGRWHYRRCQALLAYEFESPTITTLQCHMLCCVYLCCGTFQNMADSACGLAVRTAYMLGLHLEPPATLPLRERELRKRLWWALFVLDSKIGMKLGRPFIIHDSHATPSLPSDGLEIAAASGSNFAPLGENVTWLSFNLHHTLLFQVARAAYTAFFDQELKLDHGQTVWDDIDTVEALAYSALSNAKQFDEWVNHVPRVLTTKRLNDGTPFSTDPSSLDIEQFAPVWIQRQRLLLELMYHNLRLNFYRPFITFHPTGASTPVAGDGATRCAAHAIALTHITHQVLSSSSILDGWHEAFQWQWNAVMTLLGFMLAYPHSSSTAAARSAVDLSLAVFDIFGKSFSVAANTAVIIRDLSAKINFLTDQSTRQNEPAAPMNAMAENSSESGYAAMDTTGQDFDFDAFNAEQQGVYDMALAVDLWGDLGALWPQIDGPLPPAFDQCIT
jgi:hypothetical protein